jgi:hypothetical protein
MENKFKLGMSLPEGKTYAAWASRIINFACVKGLFTLHVK